MTRGGARHQQARQIGARQQQHQADDSHQNQQSLRVSRPHRVDAGGGRKNADLLAKGAGPRFGVLQFRGLHLLDAVKQNLNLGGPFGLGGTRPEPSHHIEEVVAVLPPPILVGAASDHRRHGERKRDFGIVAADGSKKGRRRYPDDGEDLSADTECLSHNRRIQCETPLPETVAHHGHRRRSQHCIVSGLQQSAHRWFEPEDGVVVARHQFAVDHLVDAVDFHRGPRTAFHEGTGEGLQVVAKIFEQRIGDH